MAQRVSIKHRWLVEARYIVVKRTLLSGLVVLALCVALIYMVWPAQAQGTPTPSAFEVLEQSFESRYPRELVFRIKARSTVGKIIGARIIWRVRSEDSNTAHRLTSFTEAVEVELEYRHNLRRQFSAPPWQVIYYRWELVDDAGNLFRTPEVKAEYTDETRDWQKLSDGKVAVYWYDRDKSFGEQLLNVSRQGFDHVANATGFTPEDELRVLVFNSQEDFCTIYLVGICQEWIGGVAIGSITIGWLDDSLPDQSDWFFNQLIPHELAHAFLNYWMGGRVNALPQWFNEGQAQNNELKGLEEELERVRFLANTGRLERLLLLDARDTITRNQSPRVRDWYATATSVVRFLYEGWGNESLGKIIERVIQGEDFERALKNVTGLTLPEFEIEWRQWLGVMEIPPTFAPTPTVAFPPTPTYPPTRQP